MSFKCQATSVTAWIAKLKDASAERAVDGARAEYCEGPWSKDVAVDHLGALKLLPEA